MTKNKNGSDACWLKLKDLNFSLTQLSIQNAGFQKEITLLDSTLYSENCYVVF